MGHIPEAFVDSTGNLWVLVRSSDHLYFPPKNGHTMWRSRGNSLWALFYDRADEIIGGKGGFDGGMSLSTDWIQQEDREFEWTDELKQETEEDNGWALYQKLL